MHFFGFVVARWRWRQWEPNIWAYMKKQAYLICIIKYLVYLSCGIYRQRAKLIDLSDFSAHISWSSLLNRNRHVGKINQKCNIQRWQYTSFFSHMRKHNNHFWRCVNINNNIMSPKTITECQWQAAGMICRTADECLLICSHSHLLKYIHQFSLFRQTFTYSCIHCYIYSAGTTTHSYYHRTERRIWARMWKIEWLRFLLLCVWWISFIIGNKCELEHCDRIRKPTSHVQ